MRPTSITARRSITVLSAGTLALAAGLATPAAAGAQELGSLTTTSSGVPAHLVPGPNTLVAVGGSPTGLCQGAVGVTVHDSAYPGSAALDWGVAVPGVGPCDLTVTLDWHNLDTGERGTKTLDVPVPRIWSGVVHPYDAQIPTRDGRVEYRLSTNGGATAGPIVVATV